MKWNFLEFQKVIKSKLCESNIHVRIQNHGRTNGHILFRPEFYESTE